MPKANSKLEGKAHKMRPPYQQKDELSAKKLRTVKCEKDGGNKNSNEQQKNVKSDPVSTENVLKCFMKYYKSSIESNKKLSLEIADNMQRNNMAAVERNQENDHLKKRVLEMQQHAQEMKNQHKEVLQDKEMLMQKCAALNSKYTLLETGCEENLSTLSAENQSLKSKLLAANNVNKDIQQQLKTETEQAQNIITQLEVSVQERDNQMVELKTNYAQLQTHYSQMEAAFDQEKLHLKETFETLVQLKETQLLQLQEQMQQKIEENSNREKLSQQLIAQLESSVQEKENRMVQLKIQYEQLQAYNSQKEAAYEQVKLQLEQNSVEVSQLKEEISHLQAELQQQTAAYTHQIEVTAQRDSELNKCMNKALILEERSYEEMKEKDAQINKLQADINLFKSTKSHLQSEIKAIQEANEQLKVDKAEQEAKSQLALNTQECQMTQQTEKYKELELKCLNITKKFSAKQSELEALKELHEKKLAELQDTLQQKDADIDACKQKTTDLELQKDQSDVKEQQYLNIIEKLSAEKTELVKQLETFKELKKKKLAELQDTLQQKNAEIVAYQQKYTDFEREKNATIAELKYKMNKIGNVVIQPVRKPTPLRDIETVNRAQEYSPTISPVVSVEPSGDRIREIETVTQTSSSIPRGAIRNRRLVKRPVYLIDTDFNTDSDEIKQSTNIQPRQKKFVPKKSRSAENSKAVLPVAPQNTDQLFDQLKKSSN